MKDLSSRMSNKGKNQLNESWTTEPFPGVSYPSYNDVAKMACVDMNLALLLGFVKEGVNDDHMSDINKHGRNPQMIKSLANYISQNPDKVHVGTRDEYTMAGDVMATSSRSVVFFTDFDDAIEHMLEGSYDLRTIPHNLRNWKAVFCAIEI